MLQKMRYSAIGFVIASALFISLVAFGQTTLNTIRPTVIDIRQDVPVIAEIDGASVPFTVGIALQVDLSGPVTASIAAAPAPIIEVATARPAGGASIESAMPLDYEEIARYSDKHVGDIYKFRATVGSVSEDYAKLSVTIDGVEWDVGGNAIILRNDDVARVLPNEVIDIVASADGRMNLGLGYKPAFIALDIEIVEVDE